MVTCAVDRGRPDANISNSSGALLERSNGVLLCCTLRLFAVIMSSAWVTRWCDVAIYRPDADFGSYSGAFRALFIVWCCDVRAMWLTRAVHALRHVTLWALSNGAEIVGHFVSLAARCCGSFVSLFFFFSWVLCNSLFLVDYDSLEISSIFINFAIGNYENTKIMKIMKIYNFPISQFDSSKFACLANFDLS